jgi:hypothetical protein
MTLTLAKQSCKLLKSGGRAGTRTPDLLRVKNRHLFQKLHRFYPAVLVFIHLGNLLRSQMYVGGPIEGRVLAQFWHSFVG